MPKISLSGRRLALLIAAAVIVVVILILVLSGLRGGSSTDALDTGLQNAGNRVTAVLDHPKQTLPIPDSSFQSFQAWYYDLKTSLPEAQRRLGPHQRLEIQVYNKDTFPPQFLNLATPTGTFVLLDSGTVGDVLQNGKPALTDATISGRAYRAYVAALTIPANLRPATVGGYFAILQPSP